MPVQFKPAFKVKQKLQVGTLEKAKELILYQSQLFRAWSQGQLALTADFFQPGIALPRMENQLTSTNQPDLRYLEPLERWQN